MSRQIHVAPAKKKAAKEFEQLLLEYPIVAAVNLESLPAKQLAVMRDKLRQTCHIRMAKRRVMNVAIEAVKGKKHGIEQLQSHMKGMPALLFTKENPFTLYKTVKKNKSKAAAKAGQKAPYDLVVPAGPTSFAPGPVIGELGSLGIKTGVENGKVAIKADSVVAKEGAVISQKLAGLLLRLGIEPMEIGLDITAVYENGMIMTRSVLDVDEDAYLGMIGKAAAQAIALSIETSFLTPETRERAIEVTAKSAVALAIETKQSPETGLNLSEAELALYTALTQGPVATTEAAPAAKAEEKKEEKNEESAAEGLGNLFG
jgi:large subunit ribosomal protein L10